MNAATMEVAGVTVHAPASVVTNLILAAQAVWLSRRTLPPWSVVLGLLGLGALAGAVKHGADAGTVHQAARIASNLCLGAAATWAAYRAAPVRRRRELWSAFAGWGVLTVVVPSFLVVVAWMAVALGAVGAIEAGRALRGDRAAARTVAGMAVGCLASAAYLGGVSLGPWIGPIDVAHLVLLAALPLLGHRATGPTSVEATP